MDIWMLAVLVTWFPVAVALALLVGRTALLAEKHRFWRVPGEPRPWRPAPVVSTTTARRLHFGSERDQRQVAS